MSYKILIVVFLATQLATANIDVKNNLSEKFKISGYIDAGFTEWGAYNTIPSREFSIRRSGFRFNAELMETMKSEIKIEVRPDELFLKNVLVSWAPVDWSRTRIGQFKRETLLGGKLSSWDLNMLERPLVYDLCENLTYAGRDQGFDIRVDLLPLKGLELRGTAGVFNGDERGEEREDNELLYTFRGEIKIPALDVKIGASAASHRQGIRNQEETSGYSLSARQNMLSADFSVDYKISNWYDISVAAEVTTGNNWALVDVIAGEEAPRFKGMWGSFTSAYHPLQVKGIKTISLTGSYDYLAASTDLDSRHTKLSIIGAVYPAKNIRFRFGGIKNSISGTLANDDYTDIMAEIGFRF